MNARPILMITYTNRKQQIYYLKAGVTKTGKPRYWASMDAEKGENVSSMPEGYEFRATANGLVTVGKIQACHIHDKELQIVQTQVDRLKCAHWTENKPRSVILYTADIDEKFMNRVTANSLLTPQAVVESFRNSAHYQAMLRFNLADESQRLFQVERMSFRGEGGWIWIGSPDQLDQLAKKFIPLLDDQEALFEHYF